MGFTRQVVQYGQRRIARKLLRAAPWLGSLVALATLGAAIRRKGVMRGTADTTLDFIPFVGGIKNVAEAIRGRDFLSDKAPPNVGN
jgi:hypothetical protein